jgi:MFS family permease
MFRMSIGVMLPEIANDFGLLEVQSGVLISSLFLGMIMTMGIAGYVSDRLGRTITSAAGLSLMSIGLLLAGYSSSYLNTLASVFIAGLGVGVFTSSLYTVMGEVLPKSRGLLAGVANGCYALGGFIGPWLTGSILSYYGWRIPFYIFGLAGVSIGVGLSFSGMRTSPNATKSRRENVTKTSGMLKTRTVLIVSAALLSANIGFGSFASWTPTFLSSVDGLDITQTGLAIGIWALTGGAGAMVLGWLSDRSSRRAVILASGISAALLAYIYFMSVSSFLIIAGLSAAFGFTAYAYWSLLISLAQDSVEPAAIGSVTGFVQNISIVGSIIAPVVAATLIAAVGVTWAMIASVSVPYLVQAVLVLASEEVSIEARQ